MTDKRSRVLAVTLVVALAVIIVLTVVIVRQGADNGNQSDRKPGNGPSRSPSSSPSPLPSATVPSFPSGATLTPDQQDLLAQRAGFGGGVTGGAGGAVVHVTTNADSGEGSLRSAVEGDSPKWIVFDQDTSITLQSALKVGSNTTIDGRGHQVELTGPDQSGIELEQVSNVIIESLVMTNFGDVNLTSKNNLPDAIHLDGAQGVWIDHNDLSMAGDKLVAVSEGSSGVTVSWNHFHDQEQTMQIGNQATKDVDGQQTVTVDHNFFDRTGYRMPVISYGRAHIYDNYYLDWRLYAVRAERNGQVYLEDNIFQGDRSKRTVLIKPGGDGCNDAKTRCDTGTGLIKAVDNLVTDAKKVRDVDGDQVFDPSKIYKYQVEPATEALAQQISDGAGPQS